MVATLAAGASPAQDKHDQGKLSWGLHELAWSMERGRRPSASSRRYVDAYEATVVTVVELGAGLDLEEVRAPIESLGATIDAVDTEVGWLEVSTPIGALRQLGELPAVARIRLPHVPTSTAIVSQGVSVMGADDFIQRTGADGTGVTVGVLDASWESPQALLGSELPADTEISAAILEGDALRYAPHGDACAEVVHDVAPGAHLVLETFRSAVSWAEALRRLGDRGVDVLSHSVAWTNVYPVDGRGYFARQAEALSRRGVLVLSAAGNDAHNLYQGTWKDDDQDRVMEFADGVELLPILVRPGGSLVSLRWNDRPGVITFRDYDLFVVTRDFADAPSFEADNPAIIASSQDLQSGAELPLERVVVDVEETRELFAVVRRDERTAARPDQQLFVYAQDAVLEHYTAAGTITSPADARSVVAVGAVYVDTLEHPWYNSLGPTEDGRIKPDVAAPSHVASASLGPDFGGTSAATPHAAGAAALLLSLYPHLDTNGLRHALETATSSGGDPTRKNNAVGFGFVDLRSAR